MTSSPTPGQEPWGEESWNESQPSRVPMVQIWMLSDEWLWDILHSSCFNVKLWSNSTNRTKLQTDERTERRKLYTPRHKSRGYKETKEPDDVLFRYSNSQPECTIYQKKKNRDCSATWCIHVIRPNIVGTHTCDIFLDSNREIRVFR